MFYSLEKEELLQREIVELNIKYEDQKNSYQELLKHVSSYCNSTL